MNTSKPTSTVMRWINWLTVMLFLLLLWLPAFDSVFHFDWSRPPSENRAMARFPATPHHWSGWQGYISGLGDYFNDHFGLRKCLVQWHGKLRRSLFHDNTSRDVLIGKDGWLFLSGCDMVDHYSGQLQFTPEQLHDWQVLLETRRDWLAKRAIKYVFVVTPDKQSIYPEYLPDWVVKVRPHTMLDQFIAYMHKHSTVPVVDVRDAVTAAKQIVPDYLKTDTHWNFVGSFAAYQKLLLTMAGQLPELKLKPLSLDDFYLTNQPWPKGDLARLMDLNMGETTGYVLLPKVEPPKVIPRLASRDRPTDPKFSTNHLAQGNLMLFHDSFGGFWAHFLGYHFNEVTYLWQYNLDPARIEREKPDIVVSEMLERFFNEADPKQMLAQEALKESAVPAAPGKK